MTVGDKKWDVAYPIEDCALVADKVIVIYDQMAGPTWRQFRNLVAFDLEGRKIWTAEHPTNETADVYLKITKADPLTVWNFGCFICRIDLETGKLLESTFTK